MCTISHHYMSVSRSVTPCPAHVFLSSFFVSVCQYSCLSVTFIRTISSIYVCVSVFLRPYVRISCSQLCVHVSVCHIHAYHTSLSCISTTVCRSTCLCVCLFSCKYITCTVVCPSRCYCKNLLRFGPLIDHNSNNSNNNNNNNKAIRRIKGRHQKQPTKGPFAFACTQTKRVGDNDVIFYL